ncbi:SPOR domain-containing protein [Amaricoccus tamworthensis]|uniref:SPOR domain-containing protein n=1 Tax=Amaricoccus tamworthensis TaxID=57002 RepID=UPI003C79D78C
MHEAYRDDYVSLMDGNGNSLIPGSVRRAVSALVFLGLIAGMGVWAWRLGTRDAREVPIIRAMEGPARITPEDQGGFVAPNTDLEINSVLEGNPAPVPRETATALAQPEVLTEEDGPQGTLEITATAPEPVEDPDAEITLGGEPVEALPEDAIAGDDAPTVQPGELSALVESLQSPEPEEAEEAAPFSTGPRPLSRPRHLRAAPAATTAASTTPAAAAPVVPKEVASVPTGSRLIQLGAFDSEQITRSAWANLVAKHGDLLGSKSLYVQRTTNNSRVFYRLRVAGFSNTTQTRDMCEALRARGVDCIPVTVQ